MRIIFLFAALLISLISLESFAAVEFRGGNWHYGGAETLTVKNIGVANNELETTQIAFTFSDGRQMILSGGHLPLGMSLLGSQGKCLKVIPGYMFKSVSLLMSCID